MLAIRMQRTGRSGHAQFRLIVQDSRFHPTRGKVVAYLGSYNPHQKTAAIDKELATRYLESGAQPSDTVARLLKKEGVKLPAWVSLSPDKQRKIRNPEKLRRNRPADAAPTETPAEPVEATAETSPEAEASAEETPSETPAETEAPAEETPVEPEPANEPAAEPEASSEEPAAESADSEPAA